MSASTGGYKEIVVVGVVVDNKITLGSISIPAEARVAEGPVFEKTEWNHLLKATTKIGMALRWNSKTGIREVCVWL